jgi:hypothetical protein
MDKRLWTAIMELLDQAAYALDVLDNYQDVEDDPYDSQPTPNRAMIAHSGLKEAAERVMSLVPPHEEPAQ